MTTEFERRKQTIAEGQTDFERWRDPNQLEQAWNQRAKFAADLIPAGATVLDLGCGAMALEQMLPPACAYVPCDVVARDRRTLVCDFNKGEFPAFENVTHVTVLGVLEYLYDVPAFLRKLRACALPVILSYNPTDFTVYLDRPALGWINHLSIADLEQALNEAGLSIAGRMVIDRHQVLLRLSPNRPPALPPPCKVLVVSSYNAGNFGDRLGYHVINEVLPAHATVHHCKLTYAEGWRIEGIPEGNFDLLVLGYGNSLFGKMFTDSLVQLLERAPRAIGIFGTQYRPVVDPGRLDAVLDRLHTWYARFEEDILWFGKGRSNVVHLGDWLISAFPMAKGEIPQTLTIGEEIWQDGPLDRTIQNIQKYRYVFTTRMHPLLCAFTSAEQVAYREQSEDKSNPAAGPSGKFRSLLIDVFGRTFPEDQFFPVDRDAVVAYKNKVQKAMEEMRRMLHGYYGKP